MNDKEVTEKLKQINTEDYIWILYLGIIVLSFISNYYERNYYLYKDYHSKDIYRKYMIVIFSILLLVYLYFLKNSVDDLMKIKPNDSSYKKKLVYLSFVASLFISISGFIFLYITLVDKNIDVELAFN